MSNKISRDLFSNSRLISLAAVEESLAEFEVAISINFHRPELIVAELLSNHQAVPLALSCINDDAFSPIKSCIFSTFKTEKDPLTECVGFQLLTILSQFLYFHPAAPSILKVQELITTNYRTVEGAAVLLKLLSSMDFVEEMPSPAEEQEDFGFRVRTRRPKGKKHTRAKSKAVDPKPFKNLGFQIPSNQTEAGQLKVQLLETLENILDFYLSCLRTAEFSSIIKSACLASSEKEPVTTRNTMPEIVEDETAVVQVIPAAFPKIQPIKSALYFDSVDGFGEWTILISQNADAELRSRHRKERHSFDIIVKKIKELSNGHFSPDNQKRLSGPTSDVPVFEAKMTADLRLIYQIDIVASDDERDKQAIKIFGIYTHAQMDGRMWHSIGQQLSRKGEEYRERCSVRNLAENADGQTFVPALFPPLPEIQEEDESPNWLSEDNPVHSRFLMDKYVVFSQPLLNTMLADLDATFPHLVSAKERQIIEHPYSCYVIGRSGTGKTTTLLFKMLLVERTHQMAGGNGPKPRQIFVTQSRILARRVDQYYQSLGRSLTATSQTVDQLCAVRTREGNAMIDETVMIDTEDDDDWSSNLPSKFSELGDEHFPLFTTFNGLCSLLEADVTAAESTSKKPSKQTTSAYANSSERGNLSVTFQVFLRDYWPHLPQSYTSKLDPALVFSELIGVIKGSEETLEGTKHFLERPAYYNMSTRNQSTFAENREDLYELFISYIAKKKRFGDVDAADRAHKILDFFKTQGIPGQKIDHLYVDEVQDNLLIDSLILRMLCHDANGLFWAGDTAQTIAAGSSFRFNSLKAFQWRLEQKRQSGSSQSRQRVEPKTFELLVNYRSHSGITNCAHSIIELITLFWKDSIDRLAPEKGVVAGLKPSFFVGWDEDAAGLDHFVFGDSDNRLEFGAQQCILVRNEAARDELQAKLGEHVGLIMTIYDSKGLEFNDVLLYNFFSDSPAKLAQWRLILSALNRSGMTAPDFERDKQRYTSICTELKFLYVAITRARENVWIVDSSQKSEAMRMYWTERDVIRDIKPGTDTPQLASSSPPEEWERQGRAFFDRRKWAQARLCFERAHEPGKMAIAEAYLLRERADRLSFDTKAARVLRSEQFVKAAEAFTKCSQSAVSKGRLQYSKLAGNCYREAREFLLAAECYRTARQFDDAVQCYRKAGKYDEAVEIVQTEKDRVDPSLAADVIRVAKMFYFNQVQSSSSSADREKKLQQAGALFDSLDDQLEYLEDRDMDIARAALLVAHGRAREAAELHLAEGRVLEAIDFFIQDAESEDSTRRAAECILEGFWRQLTFALTPEDLAGDSVLSKLFDFAKRIKQSSLSPSHRNEIAMFQAIITRDHQVLKDLGRTFFAANSRSSALLCLDHYYIPPLLFDNLTVYEMAEAQSLFHVYVRLLVDVLANPRPTEQAGLRKLFGIQKLSDSHILLSEGSFLHRTHVSTDQESQLDTLEFIRHFRECVSNRLRDRVFAQTSICKGCNTFTPCLPYAVFQKCAREASCHDAHVPPESLTVSFYNTRVKIHLQQIQIIRVLHNFYPYSSLVMISHRRLWLSRLYDALFPSSYVLGSLAVAQFQQIPEYFEAIKMIQAWVRDFILARHYNPVDMFLSDLTRLGTLAMVFDKPYAISQSLLHRGRYVYSKSPPPLFRRNSGAWMIPELTGLIDDENPSSNPNYLVAATLALGHVLSHSVPIEIGLLCDLLEKFCRSYILVGCSQRDAKLHNVTLPRSWLMKPISVEHERRKRFWWLKPMLSHIENLLAQIYNGRFADHLLFENRTLAGNVALRVRTIFISRICRAICLLGYNLGNTNLRIDILYQLTSLRKVKAPETLFPAAYRFYAEANCWEDLARALHQSTTRSSMDEMINIAHKDRYDDNRRSPRNVRTVVYDNIMDLPKLLIGAMAPIVPSSHATRPAQVLKAPQSGVPPASLLPQVQSNAGTIGNETQRIEDAKVDVIVDDTGAPENEPDDQIEDVAQQAIPTSVEGPLTDQLDIPEPTEQEYQSASIIQQAYRLYSTRKTKRPTQIAVSRNKHFTAFVQLDIQPGHYRKMMLGPLPHVLVFLELFYMGILDLKANTRKRTLLPLSSEEADLVDKRLTETINIVKKIKKWQSVLEPKSDFHSRRDCHELRVLIRTIQEFIQKDLADLPVKISPQTRAEFDTGFKGIAQEPAPPKAVPTKTEKPELNTADVYEL
ncbi:hypothetical protein GYMLUDRAFT_33762 [Collybiopsis luxurians FD-317 M1]|nr:hypothetical protein GYMLUDRAFT_33762 [Collybiopsis luxurians FD-317 M1]